jgi:predicted amidophosphoribosyltransferase
LFKDKTVLVIDDVCTTGETINQCALVLKKEGARAVYGLTLARDV